MRPDPCIVDKSLLGNRFNKQWPTMLKMIEKKVSPGMIDCTGKEPGAKFAGNMLDGFIKDGLFSDTELAVRSHNRDIARCLGRDVCKIYKKK
jgi:hypothetical protein